MALGRLDSDPPTATLTYGFRRAFWANTWRIIRDHILKPFRKKTTWNRPYPSDVDKEERAEYWRILGEKLEQLGTGHRHHPYADDDAAKACDDYYNSIDSK